jgi:hypothetical protein
MKTKLVASIFLMCVAINQVLAGEITSLQWNILGDLEVFYAVASKRNLVEVHCTAFNDENKPVGGGFSYSAGGVAHVTITVPRTYQNTDKVSVKCTP